MNTNIIDDIESGLIDDWVVAPDEGVDEGVDEGAGAGADDDVTGGSDEYRVAVTGGAIDADPDDNEWVVRVGGDGGDADTAYVCDDSNYYINLRRIELAHFEATKPSPAQVVAKFHTMFGYMINPKRVAAYKHIITQSQTKDLLYRQILRLADMINRLNELLVIKVMQAAAEGRSAALSVSLPDIDIIPSIDRGIIYDTLLMDAVVDSLLQYMRELDVRPLLRSPLEPENWEPLDRGPRYKSGIEESMDVRTKTIENMHKLLDAEEHIVAQVRNIEKYHHRVLGALGKIQVYIRRIMERL